MNWKCRRCGEPMYSFVGKDGAKTTCTGCSQYLECAQCSSLDCRDTKCIGCYNRAQAIGPKPAPPAGGPLVPQGEDF